MRTDNVTSSSGTVSTEESTVGAEGMDEDPSNLLSSFELHHDRWDRWIYYVLPAAAVLQWVLVSILAIRNQVLTSTAPGFSELRTELVSGVEPTGFFNDYFFIVWNLFPILLWATYMIGVWLGRGWIRDVSPHIDTTDASASIGRLQRIRDHWIPAVLILIFGVVSMAAQVPKQLGFFETNSQLYWWDWRVSPEIFTIRDAALFFNIVLILLVFWGTLFGLLIVIESVRKGAIEPDYFHPDGAGGLKPLGNAISVLILPWVAGAFLGVLGFFDHTTSSELLFRIGDVVLIVVCTIIATLLFAYPLYFAWQQVQENLDTVRENVYSLASQKDLAEEVRKDTPENLRQKAASEHPLGDTASIILVYQRLDEMSGWPIDSQRVIQVGVLVASPGVTVLTQSIGTFITTYWI